MRFFRNFIFPKVRPRFPGFSQKMVKIGGNLREARKKKEIRQKKFFFEKKPFSPWRILKFALEIPAFCCRRRRRRRGAYYTTAHPLGGSIFVSRGGGEQKSPGKTSPPESKLVVGGGSVSRVAAFHTGTGFPGDFCEAATAVSQKSAPPRTLYSIYRVREYSRGSGSTPGRSPGGNLPAASGGGAAVVWGCRKELETSD